MRKRRAEQNYRLGEISAPVHLPRSVDCGNHAVRVSPLRTVGSRRKSTMGKRWEIWIRGQWLSSTAHLLLKKTEKETRGPHTGHLAEA
ncbi:hypothetical protein AAC387_Pa03g0754 [Persea americana]